MLFKLKKIACLSLVAVYCLIIESKIVEANEQPGFKAYAKACAIALDPDAAELRGLLFDIRKLKKNRVLPSDFKPWEVIARVLSNNERDVINTSLSSLVYHLRYEVIRVRNTQVGTVNVNSARIVQKVANMWSFEWGGQRLSNDFLENFVDRELNPLLDKQIWVSQLPKASENGRLFADSFTIRAMGLIKREFDLNTVLIKLEDDFKFIYSSITDIPYEMKVDAVASSIIFERHKVLVPNPMQRLSTEQLAYQAWVEAGRPTMLPVVLYKLIDPVLTGQVDPTKKRFDLDSNYWVVR